MDFIKRKNAATGHKWTSTLRQQESEATIIEDRLTATKEPIAARPDIE
jgi:hypothetical protein